MTKKIFISHSSKDSKTATAICAALEARGHRCWMSSRDIMPGENFQGTIVRAIRESGVMVLVFSANANNSDEIKKEMALASQSKKMVIPVRAEDVTPSEDFTYELATRQWIDMFIDWERAIELLSQQVSALSPREDVGVRPDAAVAVPAPAKSNMPIYAGLAVLLLAGGAYAFWSSHHAAPAPAATPVALAAPTPAAATAAAPAPAAPVPNAQLESQLWDTVKTSEDPAVVQSYLDKYPDGTFTAAAKSRLAALNAPKAHASAGQSPDAEIAALYKRARANAVDTSALADEQSAWLIRRAGCGGDSACLRHSYAERRAELSRWITGE